MRIYEGSLKVFMKPLRFSINFHVNILCNFLHLFQLQFRLASSLERPIWVKGMNYTRETQIKI